MATFTNITKLVGEIHIDTLSLSNFSEAVTPIEERIMNDLLGFELYTDLLANETETKYTDLLNGGSYTGDDGYLHQVKGIKEMLPYFFYFYFLRDNESYNTSAGEFAANSENASKSIDGLNRKLVNAYNKGVDLYEQLYQFIIHKQGENGDDYYYHWLFTPKCKINHFGI